MHMAKSGFREMWRIEGSNAINLPYESLERGPTECLATSKCACNACQNNEKGETLPYLYPLQGEHDTI